ncbi:hypothetical protein [Bradyrhizobium genomosp. III]|uniref:hypothetical protein n=1 Tax=Bradyrhizobium genomosp. III TaxID=2683271 RepID=UPI0004AFB0FE|nr:hypothetical protein [Bradyrhizobium sp. CCBAU 15635]
MLAHSFKRFAPTVALLFALLPDIGTAQTFPTVPANSVIGRLGNGPGPAQAIPNSQLFSANLFDLISTTPGRIPCRGASTWGPISPGAAGGVLMSTGTTTCPAFSVPVPVASGGTGGITAATARGSSGINVESYTPHNDSNYTILASDRTVGTSEALTSARTWTLPAANSVNAGQAITVADYFGGVTSTNTLTIQRAGSNTINGSTSVVINVAYGRYEFRSDGVSKWSAVASSGGSGSLPYRSPLDYGAACNGTTDDKTALQAWLDALPNTYIGFIPPGRTCAFGNGSGGTSGNGLIFVKSNTTIVAPGATLKLLAPAPLNSGLMLTDPTQGTAAGPTNVRISGLNLDGNKTARGCTTTPGPTQCSAATLYAVSAQDVWIENIKCVQGAADCFYVGGNDTLGGLSRRVYMNNITCSVATRNCLSVVGVSGMTVNGCNMSGAISAPGHGIDVEPDSTNTTVNDLTVSQCVLSGNGGDGISINPGNITGGVNRGLGFMLSSNSNTGSGYSQYNTAKALNGWKFAGAFGAGNGVSLFAAGPSVAADSLP